MDDWIRGSEHFPPSSANASALWAEIEKVVEEQVGSKPFADLTLHPNVSGDYQPSRNIESRFSLVDGHSRYKRTREATGVEAKTERPLGPVELDLLDFVNSPNPILLVLLGGMGSGKTTTIRFMDENFRNDRTFLICNFDENLVLRQSELNDFLEDIVAGELARYLSRELFKLITPEEEITKMWTWALSDGSKGHPAKNVLDDAQYKLCAVLDNGWLSESAEAIAVRKEARDEIKKNPFHYLHYQALRLDYYLTFHCSGDKSKFLLILDNGDPLAPAVQTKIYRLASSFQLAARCKMLVAFRPLTYSSNCQGASRLVEVVEHVGPSVVDVIKRCTEKKLIACELSKLSVTVREQNGAYRVVKESEVRQWIEDILAAIAAVKAPGPRGDPNARSFIEGICGHSIRSALAIAPEIFGSPATPPLPTGIASGQTQRVRDHEVIRSIVEGWQGFYCADPSRITHNIFDLGTRDSRSCTSKVRLLKKLKSSKSGITGLGEVIQHLSRFGYSEKLILDTINDVMMNTKMLAWSDSVHSYRTLDGHHNSRLQISSAGAYYVEHAIFNLEYVQGVHVDVLLPRSETLQHDPRSFSMRLRSLEMFVRFLHRQELEEVKRMMFSPIPDYTDIYGTSLFSLEIIEALVRQIKSVGGALLKNPRMGRERFDDVSGTLSRWDSMLETLHRDSRPVLDKIDSLRSG